MQIDWTKGLSEDDAEEMRSRIKRSRPLLERLNEILDQYLKEEEVFTKDSYESPSWAYRAADREGFKRALHKIKLLTKEERNNNT